MIVRRRGKKRRTKIMKKENFRETEILNWVKRPFFRFEKLKENKIFFALILFLYILKFFVIFLENLNVFHWNKTIKLHNIAN